jgi:hypothetical protein
MASTACFILRRPSKPKGLVTIPTVSAPSSREISATTGAAPLPVPPPMPLNRKEAQAIGRGEGAKTKTRRAVVESSIVPLTS